MIVTVKNEVDRARGQAARSPEQGLAGALQGQYKRQDKNRFFRAENLGYTNNRPSLSSTHRSVSPSGELSNGDGSPVRFLISTVRYISTAEDRIARATLERARVRAPSHERAAELGTFVSFFFLSFVYQVKT